MLSTQAPASTAALVRALALLVRPRRSDRYITRLNKQSVHGLMPDERFSFFVRSHKKSPCFDRSREFAYSKLSIISHKHFKQRSNRQFYPIDPVSLNPTSARRTVPYRAGYRSCVYFPHAKAFFLRASHFPPCGGGLPFVRLSSHRSVAGFARRLFTLDPRDFAARAVTAENRGSCDRTHDLRRLKSHVISPFRSLELTALKERSSFTYILTLFPRNVKRFFVKISVCENNTAPPTKRGMFLSKFLINKVFGPVLAFEIELAEIHRHNAHTSQYNAARKRDDTREHEHEHAVPERGAHY